MSYLYTELPAVPLPPGAKPVSDAGDANVFCKPSRSRSRTIVGRLASETTMHVNSNYRFLFPNLWYKHYARYLVPGEEVRVGLYSMLLALGWKSRYYLALASQLGCECANIIMDCATSALVAQGEDDDPSDSCAEEGCGLSPLWARLRRQHFFSVTWPGETWFADKFCTPGRVESLESLRTTWLAQSRRNLTVPLMLVLGRSVLDSTGELAADDEDDGAAQADYLCAIDAATSTPVFWQERKPEQSTRELVENFLGLLGENMLSADTIVLEESLASEEVRACLAQTQLKCITLLDTSSELFADMMQRKAKDLEGNASRLMVEDDVFGVAETVPGAEGRDGSAALYFNLLEGTGQRLQLMRDVREERRRLLEQLPAEQGTVAISPALERYLEFSIQDEQITDVQYVYPAWQQDLDSCGFLAMTCSEECSAQELYRLCLPVLRFRRQFDTVCTILAGETPFAPEEGQSTAIAVRCRLDTGVAAAAMCCLVVHACRELGIAESDIAGCLNTVRLRLLPGDQYAADELSDVCRILLKSCGIAEGNLSCFAGQLNGSVSIPLSKAWEETYPLRQLPGMRRPRHSGSGKQAGTEAGADVERPADKAGKSRVREELEALEPGSEERAAKLAELRALQDEEARQYAAGFLQTGGRVRVPKKTGERVPGRRGRPKGSKNKATLEREARIAAGLEPAPQKRGPGRPRIRPVTPEEEIRWEDHPLYNFVGPMKRRRGRPKGTKNRKTLAHEALQAVLAAGQTEEVIEVLKKAAAAPGQSDAAASVVKLMAEAMEAMVAQAAHDDARAASAGTAAEPVAEPAAGGASARPDAGEGPVFEEERAVTGTADAETSASVRETDPAAPAADSADFGEKTE